MPTEILRRGDELSPTTTPQGDGATTAFPYTAALTIVLCVNGCGLPMQPLDRDGIAYRCSACDKITVDRAQIDVVLANATTTFDRALFELLSLRTLLYGLALTGGKTNTKTVLDVVAQVIEAMTSAPAEAHAEMIHTAAIGHAVRMCQRRAESLMVDSHNPVAANEAAKCAFAVARLLSLSSVTKTEAAEPSSDVPEVPALPDSPEAAHA